MKIKRFLKEKMSIEEFADEHGFTLEIHERDPSFGNRFFVYFSKVEVKREGILGGGTGDGKTESEAIANYARNISGKRIVFGAYTPERKELTVPRLI